MIYTRGKLPRKQKGVRALIIFSSRAPEGNGKIGTHFPEPEENKMEYVITIMFPRYSGSSGKSSLERGWILCGNARKGQFSPR